MADPDDRITRLTQALLERLTRFLDRAEAVLELPAAVGDDGHASPVGNAVQANYDPEKEELTLLGAMSFGVQVRPQPSGRPRLGSDELVERLKRELTRRVNRFLSEADFEVVPYESLASGMQQASSFLEGAEYDPAKGELTVQGVVTIQLSRRAGG